MIFRLNVSQMMYHLNNFQTRLEGCEYTLKKHFAKQQQRMEGMTSKLMQSYITKIQQQLDQIVAEKLNVFEQQLNSMIEEMVQDVKLAADEANDTMNNNMKEHLNKFSETIRTQREAAENSLK